MFANNIFKKLSDSIARTLHCCVLLNILISNKKVESKCWILPCVPRTQIFPKRVYEKDAAPLLRSLRNWPIHWASSSTSNSAHSDLSTADTIKQQTEMQIRHFISGCKKWAIYLSYAAKRIHHLKLTLCTPIGLIVSKCNPSFYIVRNAVKKKKRQTLRGIFAYSLRMGTSNTSRLSRCCSMEGRRYLCNSSKHYLLNLKNIFLSWLLSRYPNIFLLFC